MRTAFAQELTALAKTNDKIVLLVGDIGNTLFDDFKQVAPNRFFNCGIAEQNMVSMAAGLAKSGFRPVCFTIAPFLTARCFEQIKIDLGYHNVPVVLAAVGAGLCYANLGPTHQALDDIAILRTVPNLKIAAPHDALDVRSWLRVCLKDEGPTYLRLGRDGETGVFRTVPEAKFGWTTFGWTYHKDALVHAIFVGNTATMLPVVQDILREEPVVLSACASVKPVPLIHAEVAITIEEHGVIGGFGSALLEQGTCQRVVRIGTPDEFLHSPMTSAEAREYCGLTPEKIASRIRDELQRLR